MTNKTNILIVDDELPVCKSIASVLEDQGFFIDTAMSGEEALKKLEKFQPDVIIADLMMPGISGMELLRIVKEKRPDIMLIIVTGFPSIKSAVQAIKLGAFDYIPKPFTPQELRSMVSRALERKNLFKEMGLIEERAEKISIPCDLYCIPENSWAKVEEDGNVRIGIHHMLIKTIKHIVDLEFPKEKEMRFQGEACLRITDDRQRIHRLWSPVTGHVIAINSKIQKDISKILKDPYGEGWLLLIAPSNLEQELKNLSHLEVS